MFEYDPEKAQINLAKHGMSFYTAMEAFFDPYRHITDVSKLERDAEIRKMVVGMISNPEILLAVVFHEKENGVFRLISARKTQPREKRAYLENRVQLGGSLPNF